MSGFVDSFGGSDPVRNLSEGVMDELNHTHAS